MACFVEPVILESQVLLLKDSLPLDSVHSDSKTVVTGDRHT